MATTNITKLENCVNPQVMADMVSAEYTKKLQLIPFAEVDNTLQGQAGNTITLAKWNYIGQASDLAEGVEGDIAAMSKSTDSATIKKCFKGIALTDEAMLSGYGDPMGEAAKQLGMSLADKVDSDLHTTLAGIAAGMTYSKTTEQISYGNVVAAIDKFQDETQGEDMYLIIHPSQLTTLRLDAKFTPASEMGDRVVETGVVGMIAGAKVVLSKKIAPNDDVFGTYADYIVKPGALKIYTKRGAVIETDRDIRKKETVITADEHYVTHLYDTSKAVKLAVKA